MAADTPMDPFDSPRLIADIGGTYARFALETAPGSFEHQASLPCQAHADFHAAVSAYLATLPADARVQHAAIAIANPVEGDHVRMTNYHWQFSIEDMRQRLGLVSMVVVNDFTALAMSLPRMAPHERRQVGGGTPRVDSVIGLLGPGTGLGVSGLIPAADGWVALGTEGGHASFSPRDEREVAILRHAWQRYPHVSFERLLSGPGMTLMHEALCLHAGRPAESPGAPEITRRALADGDPACLETLDAFCGMLGTAAANLAVTFGAMGGVYIGGGIVPRLGEYFDRSSFRVRFEDKGRFSGYVGAIPTYVFTAPNATLLGASAILAAQLARLGARPGSALLQQIERTMAQLSPAERRVAGHVLAHPRTALNDPIAEIARASGVSQPTVIRFCRSLGCEGLSDFKLRLASGLTGTVPITHTQVTGADSSIEVGEKVLGNTASAVLQLRDHLNRDAIERATGLLTEAARVEFYAVGHYGAVAQDAQFKFLRFGVPSSAIVEPRLQRLAANVLQAGDVAVVISSSGQIDELLGVADRARERGAAVIAVTASQSPLARRADVALIVDHVEDVATQVPMVSRILHLLVVDILAVGVAMRRGSAGRGELPEAAVAGLDENGPGGEPPVRARRTAPGVSAAGPLAQLTSHSRGESRPAG